MNPDTTFNPEDEALIPVWDAKFLAKWVKALRSGKYKQAPNYLYNPDMDGYCCLGVACSVKRLPVLSPSGGWLPLPSGNTLITDWYEQARLKDKESTFHVTYTLPILAGDGMALSLTYLNDLTDSKGYHKFTFSQIADLIERFYGPVINK